MVVTVRSFAKINFGLGIGPSRPDGFHELRTVYQTIAMHDSVSIEVVRGRGVEIRCSDPRVPGDSSNTCFRIAEVVRDVLKFNGRAVVTIEKKLPIQGGLGGASGNAVATMLALELAVGKRLDGPERLKIAAEVGSDLPLFLVGGTVLGVGRGEEVYPLRDLPATHCVVALPEVGVSTPQAFRDWDELRAAGVPPREGRPSHLRASKRLTPSTYSGRLKELSNELSSWLSGSSLGEASLGESVSGVPVRQGRGRAETPLLDLVRTGIENDFEKVVFPKYPELRDVKRVLEGSGAFYASLSGSGSAIYGLYESQMAARKAEAILRRRGIKAVATTTLTRRQFRNKFLVESSASLLS